MVFEVGVCFDLHSSILQCTPNGSAECFRGESVSPNGFDESVTGFNRTLRVGRANEPDAADCASLTQPLAARTEVRAAVHERHPHDGAPAAWTLPSLLAVGVERVGEVA